MIHRSIGLALIAVLFLSSPCHDVYGYGKPKPPVPSAVVPASLEQYQGKYFKCISPPGWRVSETDSGITVTSPDGKCAATLASLVRSRGSITPEYFLDWVFTHVPGWKKVRVLSIRDLPSRQIFYQPWEFIEARVMYVDNGLPVTGVYQVGVTNYGPVNDAIIVGYRAAREDFERMEPIMEEIARSIAVREIMEAKGEPAARMADLTTFGALLALGPTTYL